MDRCQEYSMFQIEKLEDNHVLWRQHLNLLLRLFSEVSLRKQSRDDTDHQICR